MTFASLKSPSTEVLNLEIAREADRIKISLATQQSGEMQTVRHIEELAVSMEHINARCRRMVATLNQANRQGHLSSELLGKLKEAGQLFRDDLFSPHIKSQFNASTADQLIVTLDDHLVHIPWELLHDGEQFLSQRFAMGRVVRTRQQVVSRVSREVTPPLQMLVLADPCGDLESAYAEGVGLRDFMDGFQERLWVSFRSEGVNPDFLKAKIRLYDWVHFAGHADYSDQNHDLSGWRLSHGQLSAADIIKMAGTGAMPALVFSNACQSARTAAWDVPPEVQDRIFGLANAFILSGVKHYVGTFWEIPDETSRRFALAFYHFLLHGLSVGAAMRAARRVLIDAYGEENIVWASYLLYGDPSVAYFEKSAVEDQAEPSPAAAPGGTPNRIAAALRAPEEVIRFTSKQPGRRLRKRRLIGIGVAALVLLLVIMAAVYMGIHDRADQYEQRALVAFQAGRYAEVEQTCRRLQDSVPRRSLSYLLLGNVSFFKGDLKKARFLYQNTIQAERGSLQDKAEAMIGLGRIASESGQTEQAIQYYQKAADLAPGKAQPYVAQAMLLDRQGDIDKAAELLQLVKSNANIRDSAVIEALAARMELKASQAADQQRQERIDRLIGELQVQMQTAGRPAPPFTRKWSSRPLTVWLMDLENAGYSLQEGSAALLTGAITDRLLEQARLHIVERDLLDKLMAELKLGASNLTEMQTALLLGHLVAARFIFSGRMVHQAPHTQITLRCIETETSRVTIVVNATFGVQTPISEMADRIADELTLKIQKHYPLRAKVIEHHDDKLILDIGRRHGAAIGLTLKCVDTDLTVQVMNVDSDKCSAQVIAGETPIEVGMRLEETQ